MLGSNVVTMTAPGVPAGKIGACDELLNSHMKSKTRAKPDAAYATIRLKFRGCIGVFDLEGVERCEEFRG